MHEIVIPMVPSRNLIGKAGWWRNSHNDREVWRRRVGDAVAGRGLLGVHLNASVVFDWGTRAKPGDCLQPAVEVLTDALAENGVVVRFCHAEVQQSGRGKGETRIVLESNACLGDD